MKRCTFLIMCAFPIVVLWTPFNSPSLCFIYVYRILYKPLACFFTLLRVFLLFGDVRVRDKSEESFVFIIKYHIFVWVSSPTPGSLQYDLNAVYIIYTCILYRPLSCNNKKYHIYARLFVTFYAPSST